LLATAIVVWASSALAAELQVHKDLPYAEPKNERQSLDVFAPNDGENHPIVFWIHGGGWEKGDKSDVQTKPQAFVDRGFIFVSINYRLLPEATIKQMAGDVAKAMRWTCEHAKEYGGNPGVVIVGGHSAGAQLAALVCTDGEYLKAEGLPLSIVKGCVPVDGDTYDVPLQIATEPPKSAESHAKKFGSVESQKDLSPVTHVAKGKDIPPFLILHVADNTLTKMQANRLSQVLDEADVTAKLVAAEGKTHGTINSDLGLPDDKPTQALWEFVESANLIRVGNAEGVIWGAELERNEKTSKIRIGHKQGVHISSVGGPMFAVSVFYGIAKARKCEYFVNLEDWTDKDGGWIYIVGFTNNKDADIKQEFGAEFSNKNESGQQRMLLSVSDYAQLFERQAQEAPVKPQR
jgi:acetyl esterase/lipase